MDTTRVVDPLIAALLNVIPDCVMLLDASGRVIMANHTSGAFLNKAVEELIDTNVFDTLPPSVAQARRARLKAVVATGKPAHFEDQHDGRCIDNWFHPVADANGSVSCVLVTGKDITEYTHADSTLRENEQRYRELADSITDLFFALDDKLNCTYWNKACERLTGVPAAYALGKTPANILLDAPSREMAMNVFSDVLTTRRPHAFVSTTQITGADRVFEISVYPSASGISVFAHDITERRRRDEALRQSEEQFRSLYEHAALGMTLVGTDDCLLVANPFFCHMLGYGESEVLNRSWKEITHPGDLTSEVAHNEALLRGDCAFYEHEKRYRHRDGWFLWARETVSCVRDSAGYPLYRIVVVQDITTRKKAEAALREEEERFRATFEQAVVGIAHVALDGSVLMANDRFCEMLDCSQQDLSARTIQEITGAGKREPSPADDRLRRGEIQKYAIEKRYPRQDGRVLWIYLTVSLVRDRLTGAPRYYVAVVEDITARKEAERALLDLGGRLIDAQEEERKRVARELHDGVGQAVGLLGIEADKAAGNPVVASVRDSLQRVSIAVSHIARDLHQISHRLHPSTLDHLGLSLAIKEHCEALSAHHRHLQITFTANSVPHGIPPEIQLCLFRIVQEALGNVVKHSGASRAQVTLGLESQDMVLSVEDDGCGFDVDRAFIKGGLGLVSMRERLRIIGGSLAVLSTHSAGTRIEVRAPAISSQNSRAA